jgi:thioredoxin 1
MNKIKIIKFSAEWCAPCRVFAPVFEEVKKEMETDKLQFESLTEDDEDNRFFNLCQKFGVRGIPAILILDDLEITLYGKISGTRTKEDLKNEINGFLKDNGLLDD